MSSIPSTSGLTDDADLTADADDLSDDSGSENPHLPPTKTRKLAGSATYRTKFHPEWKKEFNFITNVPGDPYRYDRIVCILSLNNGGFTFHLLIGFVTMSSYPSYP